MPMYASSSCETIQLYRFWKKVTKTTTCWIWIANKNRDGYGRFLYKDRVESAHRASWMIHKGSIPSGLDVLHSCDNPSCVNPNHLFLGDDVDNQQDSIQKGRRVSNCCPKGHPLKPYSCGADRRCRICGREYDRQRYAKLRKGI